MSQRARNTIPRISIVAVVLALRVFAQVAEVRLLEGKLRITTVQGRQYELEESNGSEQSLRVSPGRTKVFYHLPFDGYDTKHELVAKVWSFADPDRAAQLRVWIKSRFIDRVEWIDDRYVLIAGDGRGVVVDTENPGVTHRLWGGRLAISPDRKKLLYVQAVGRAPRELTSNVAAVAVVGMGTNPTHEPPESMESGVHEVYPPESDPTRGTPAPIPERRHIFLTGILWFSDSERAVLVENQDDITWLVVLSIQVLNGAVSASHLRFPLPARIEEGTITRFAWSKPDEEVEVVAGNMRLIANPIRRTARMEAASHSH